MKGGPEAVPITGRFHKIGPRTTADSVVGQAKPMGMECLPDMVVKWSRRDFKNRDEACLSAEYTRRAVDLYTRAFGPNHIVPTDVLVGQNKVGGGLFPFIYKIYLVQPYISGWEGRELPALICARPDVSRSWTEVYEVMRDLQSVAKRVNSELPTSERFPINLTIGSINRMVSVNENGCPVPSTPNVIVEYSSHVVKLFDFGGYEVWHDCMNLAFQKIKSQF